MTQTITVDLVDLQHQHARLLEILDQLNATMHEPLEALQDTVGELVFLLDKGPVLVLTEEQEAKEEAE